MFSSSDIPFTTGTYKPLGSGEFGNVRRHLNADSGLFLYDMLWIVSSRLESCIDNGGCTATKIASIEFCIGDIIRCGGELVVSNDEDCSKLLQTGWTTITVNKGVCSSMKDLVFSENYCLQKLEVKSGALSSLNSLTISSMLMIEMIWLDLLQFTNLTVEGFGALFSTSLTLSSITVRDSLIWSSWVHHIHYNDQIIHFFSKSDYAEYDWFCLIDLIFLSLLCYL